MSEIESLKQHYKKILDLISLILPSLTVDIFQEKKEEDLKMIFELIKQFDTHLNYTQDKSAKLETLSKRMLSYEVTWGLISGNDFLFLINQKPIPFLQDTRDVLKLLQEQITEEEKCLIEKGLQQ